MSEEKKVDDGTIKLVSRKKVKEVVKGMDKKISSEACIALNDLVISVLKKAAERADGNKRSTIRSADL